ncbi:hypothetical protein BU23DRAFT_566817 [Bimuria novae-zelandiae CBS 107.79]|uniref:Uncharacterized protein n=1 Tax=Bimuria novae-zelandiae CBS 107.79 TaxID=1447943 RepID=A0A6A5VCP2_9PLEO|nr:hypothetical protein BU23DRAFT_566817 [Bimuria novae-zelandiae CBS 107.79]
MDHHDVQSQQFTPLDGYDEMYDEDDSLVEGYDRSLTRRGGNITKRDLVTMVIFVTLIGTIILEASLLASATSKIRTLKGANRHVHVAIVGLSLERNKERTIYGHSSYVSQNETEASIAWNSILAGHGIVAVTSQFKDQLQLHDTLLHPNGSGYHIYGLDAYHAMHCVCASPTWCRGHDLHASMY